MIFLTLHWSSWPFTNLFDPTQIFLPYAYLNPIFLTKGRPPSLPVPPAGAGWPPALSVSPHSSPGEQQHCKTATDQLRGDKKKVFGHFFFAKNNFFFFEECKSWVCHISQQNCCTTPEPIFLPLIRLPRGGSFCLKPCHPYSSWLLGLNISDSQRQEIYRSHLQAFILILQTLGSFPNSGLEKGERGERKKERGQRGLIWMSL